MAAARHARLHRARGLRRMARGGDPRVRGSDAAPRRRAAVAPRRAGDRGPRARHADHRGSREAPADRPELSPPLPWPGARPPDRSRGDARGPGARALHGQFARDPRPGVGRGASAPAAPVPRRQRDRQLVPRRRGGVVRARHAAPGERARGARALGRRGRAARVLDRPPPALPREDRSARAGRLRVLPDRRERLLEGADGRHARAAARRRHAAGVGTLPPGRRCAPPLRPGARPLVRRSRGLGRSDPPLARRAAGRPHRRSAARPRAGHRAVWRTHRGARASLPRARRAGGVRDAARAVEGGSVARGGAALVVRVDTRRRLPQRARAARRHRALQRGAARDVRPSRSGVDRALAVERARGALLRRLPFQRGRRARGRRARRRLVRSYRSARSTASLYTQPTRRPAR